MKRRRKREGGKEEEGGKRKRKGKKKKRKKKRKKEKRRLRVAPGLRVWTEGPARRRRAAPRRGPGREGKVFST